MSPVKSVTNAITIVIIPHTSIIRDSHMTALIRFKTILDGTSKIIYKLILLASLLYARCAGEITYVGNVKTRDGHT